MTASRTLRLPLSEDDLFGAQPLAQALPEGFDYWSEVIGPADERALADALAVLPFEPFDFHGYKAHRHVVGFGYRYDYDSRRIMEAPPIPEFLQPLRRRIGALFGRPADAFQQVLINRYAPGAGIGWHRDKPHFEDVVGVSLLAPCAFRFRRKDGARWERRALELPPRSAYLMSGPSRNVWEHSIREVDALRYSITLRTLRT